MYRPCESGDITFFILSRDRDIEELRDFVDGVLSSYVTTLLSLGTKVLWKWKYNVFYLSHDHDIEESRDFVGRVLSS